MLLRRATYFAGYFGWLAFLAIPSDVFRFWVICCLAPGWAVCWLHLVRYPRSARTP